MFSLMESTLCYLTTDKLLAGISQILLLTVQVVNINRGADDICTGGAEDLPDATIYPESGQKNISSYPCPSVSICGKKMRRFVSTDHALRFTDS